LKPHLESTFAAFYSLMGDRQLGAMGGCGQISFMAISEYAKRRRISDGDEFDRFEALIRRMDNVYLEHVADQVRKAAQN
jgi:hypothetical protein